MFPAMIHSIFRQGTAQALAATLLALSPFPAMHLHAQKAIGQWTLHLSYHNPTRCEPAGSRLYVVANGGLYAYDKEDNSVQTYSKADVLNDTGISYIAYGKEQRTLLIVYENANIDLLTKDDETVNLPDYMNKELIGEKRVNHACFDRQYAYLSTSQGVLVVDLEKQEINNHYNLDRNILAAHVEQGRITVAANDGLYTGLLTDNLLDTGNWTKTSSDISGFLSLYQDVPMKEEVPEGITPNSPLRNYPYYMCFADERLLIAGGGHIADRLYRPGTIMQLDDTRWTSFQEEGIYEKTGQPYRDINCVAQDPLDTEHHFAASAGEGIYEFRNGQMTNWYSMHNSPLTTALPGYELEANYVRINGLIYDSSHNLWMVNSETSQAVHVLKDNGEWVTMDCPELSEASNFGRTIFDRRGWLWATSSRIESGGLFCLDYNHTIDDRSDDHERFVTQFTDQDGTILDQRAVYCIAEDKEGAIWIGTNQGPLVLNNPSDFFSEDLRCTRIKINRDDGSGLADVLLDNETINAIAVDGANRKWIGTESNGIYLLSADGTETIQHFTPDNSPLPSASIQSIAIHPRNGEVYIGTSKGLASYQSDATEAEESFDKGNVRAYPNPVRPEYNGPITITGMEYDSDVKITDMAGHLVYQGRSLGGQFVWDGRNRQGRRVASGVYMVLAADKHGKEGVACKILVVR